MVPSAASWTLAAQPTVAKSPARRSSFWYEPPVPRPGRGIRTSVRISSGSIAVWNGPTKNSRARRIVSPATEWVTIAASVASSTAGQSDDGSAWATEPPIVPQLRTCGSPIPPAASWTIE